MRGQFGSTLNGFALTNLVTNGNFASGTTGWNADNCTLSAVANVLSVTTGNLSNNSDTYSNIGLKAVGKKYYARAIVRVTNNVCTKLELTSLDGIGTVYNPTINTWYTLSGIITATSNYQFIVLYQNYVDVATANGKVMEIKEVMVVDMGTNSSNPLYNLTVDQMNARTQYWFDGTKSTLSINSPLRSL